MTRTFTDHRPDHRSETRFDARSLTPVAGRPQPGQGATRSVTGAAAAMPSGPVFAVRLIDRRTGRPHRVNGAALTLFSRAPQEAVSELMEGRDPAIWLARVDALETQERRAPSPAYRAGRRH